MKSSVATLALCCCWLLASSTSWSQPYGLSNRIANSTLRLPSALPVFGYAGTNIFGTRTFTAPVAIVTPPGETNRVFIVEQAGIITVFTNFPNTNSATFLSLSNRVQFSGEQGLLGLAFHPGYQTNRYFYVFYVTPGPRNDRLSRFEISSTDPNRVLPDSELVLINQRDDYSNHNGGDLHFGPDGYLYVSLGDEGDGNDTGANSQRIDKDFFAAILRIDVDKRPGSLSPTAHPASSTNYAVPADNPFVGATAFNGLPLAGNVRTEIWAIGLRNPWRISFDPVSGLLYCGDVGQNAREEVDIIARGGNYGWNYREGFIARPGSGSPPAGFSAVNPILDYARTPAGLTNIGNSITGGIVYHGDRLPELTGAYIFGDYGSGNIWALRYNGSTVTAWWQLFRDGGVAAFGRDPQNGDVLYADVDDGVVKRLVKVPISGGALPATLADTGAFTNLATLTPHAGIAGYDVNLPSWSDDAEMQRWFYVPSTRTITFRPTNNWTFPTGTVWMQHFDLELTNNVPESRRRLETRFLVRDSGNGVYGVTYRWDDAQTNAVLVAEEGLNETFFIHDNGTVRTQVWRYPSRMECLRCHTPQTLGGWAVGFNTPQLNRDYRYPNGVTDNQLRSFRNAGYFNASPALTNLHTLRALVSLSSADASVEQRVRSYLAVNCSPCHQPSGGGNGDFDARYFTPLALTRLINGSLNDTLGDMSNRVVAPGSLAHSVLLTRMTALDHRRMPPVGSTVVDLAAVDLISRWITNDLAGFQSFADWQTTYWGSTNATEAHPDSDPDDDGARNSLEYLTGTNPTLATEFWDIDVEREEDRLQVVFPRVPNRGFEVQWRTNLFNEAPWQVLNVPENQPFFSSTNGLTRVPDQISEGPSKFYRVRVYEP